jgi:seryl-tRNA synthetase
MHDIKWIRDNPDAFDAALKRRNLNDEEKKAFSSQHLNSIDDLRRARIRVLENWQSRRNVASKAIGQAKAKKDDAAVGKLMSEVEECKNSIATLEQEVRESEKQLKELLERIPNLPAADVPDGKDEAANQEHHKFFPLKPQEYKDREGKPYTPKQHFDLGEALGQMDFETAAKLSGARFVVLKGGLARMERALGQFMLDMHTRDHGYIEVAPPLLVRDNVMFGTAQLPKFKDDQFISTDMKWREDRLKEILEPLEQEIDRRKESPKKVVGELIEEADTVEKYWLIPTAEVPLTNLVRESIVDEAELPLRYTACTPCFRAEAGAAGKDTRGMIRQHQFTKVELVSITTPEQSKDEHERMLACAEEVLRRLDLRYRVVTLSTGDMGFPSQKTYDIEVWLPGQNTYREISSCSICGDFQARRMNARCRPKGGAPRFVHTLNGSGVAVGRALIAVMETYQQEGGSIAVPEALQSYMGGMKVIEKA